MHLFKAYTPGNKICVYINGIYLDYDQIITVKYLLLDVFNKPLAISDILLLEDVE